MRNLTQKDYDYIHSRQSLPGMYDIYKSAKIEFENKLLSNEKVAKIISKIDEE